MGMAGSNPVAASALPRLQKVFVEPPLPPVRELMPGLGVVMIRAVAMYTRKQGHLLDTTSLVEVLV